MNCSRSFDKVQTVGKIGSNVESNTRAGSTWEGPREFFAFVEMNVGSERASRSVTHVM